MKQQLNLQDYTEEEMVNTKLYQWKILFMEEPLQQLQ